MSAYCINLPEATERRALVEGQFTRAGFYDVQYRCAARPSQAVLRNDADMALAYPARGMIGCTLSHLRCLIEDIALAEEGPTVIFEDDAVLSMTRSEAYAALHGVAAFGWDVFYFGGQPMANVERTKHPGIGKGSRFWGAYAYAIHPSIREELCFQLLDKLTVTSVDHVLGMNDNYRKYCMTNPGVRTREGYSYISCKDEDWQRETDRSWQQWRV